MNRTNAYSPRYAWSPRAFVAPVRLADGGLADIEFLHYGLRKGSSGPEVKQLQEMLIKVGYSVGSAGADGKFGDNTLAAVYKWQRDNGLPEVNTVGNGMWTRLREQAGYAKTAAPAPTTTQSAPPQTQSAPSAPAQTQTTPTSQQQSGQEPDFWQSLNQIGQTVGGAVQTAQQWLGGSNQNQPSSQSSASTPPTVPQQSFPQQSFPQQNFPQQNFPQQSFPQQSFPQQSFPQQSFPQQSFPQRGDAGGEAEYEYVVVEAPIKTAARYGIPAVIGVGAGMAAHRYMAKPTLVFSLLVGAATAVGAFVAGNVIFPPPEQRLSPEQLRLIEQESAARRSAA